MLEKLKQQSNGSAHECVSVCVVVLTLVLLWLRAIQNIVRHSAGEKREKLSNDNACQSNTAATETGEWTIFRKSCEGLTF